MHKMVPSIHFRFQICLLATVALLAGLTGTRACDFQPELMDVAMDTLWVPEQSDNM
jgi:hypothetical protein